MKAKVAVVGAGITGLSAAWELRRIGAEVVVLEAADRAGGKIEGSRVGGIDVDSGPDGFLIRDPAMADLCRRLGLGDELVPPAESRAFVWVDGALRPLPRESVLGAPYDAGAAGLSDILSPSGLADLRLRLRRAFPPLTGDASVGEVLRPRIGDEAFARLVDPLLGGVNAGSANQMSVAASAAPFHEAARRGGPFGPALRSVARAQHAAATQPGAAAQHAATTQPGAATPRARATTGAVPARPLAASRRTADRARASTRASNGAGRAPVFNSVRGGTARIVAALAAELRDALFLRTPVRSLARVRAGAAGRRGWRLDTPRGSVFAEAVILAPPAWVTAGLVAPHSPDAAAFLADIEYADAVLVTFVVPAELVARPLEGSGFLVPRLGHRGRGPLTTACSWSSSKWEHYRRPDRAVLRVSAGRTDDRRWLGMDRAALVARLSRELADFGILADFGVLDDPRGACPPPREDPDAGGPAASAVLDHSRRHHSRGRSSRRRSLPAVRVTPWPRSLPQYRPGHLERVNDLERCLAADASGLIAAGAALRGLGLPACVRQGRAAATRALNATDNRALNATDNRALNATDNRALNATDNRALNATDNRALNATDNRALNATDNRALNAAGEDASKAPRSAAAVIAGDVLC